MSKQFTLTLSAVLCVLVTGKFRALSLQCVYSQIVTTMQPLVLHVIACAV